MPEHNSIYVEKSPGVKSGLFISPGRVSPLPGKEEEVTMKIIKIIMIIKKIIAFRKAIDKLNMQEATNCNDVKHPAEFLLRW